MTTITVSGNENYSDGTPAITPVVDQILFTNAGSATATFGSNQFGGLISNNVALTGNASLNRVQVVLSATGTFSAAGWTFSNWTEGGSDVVILTGTADADTITGSSKADDITGDGGADILAGGNGNDAFQYQGGQAASGEQIDGGDGNDQIRFVGSGAVTNDFSGATIVSVEKLVLNSLGDTIATFNGTQLRAGAITAIESTGASARSIIVNGGKVDLSALTFTGWGAANQTITINGAGIDTLVGSSQKDTINGGALSDTITGGAGADTLNGGLGDDTFIFAATFEASGDTVNGGLGSDAIRVTAVGGQGFQLTTFSSIERLQLFARDTTFLSTQFGTGLSNTLAVAGDVQANEIFVSLAGGQTSFTASGWTFDPSWSAADHVTLDGTTAADTLTGSVESDIFAGRGGADILTGLAGDDIFRFDAGEVVSGLSLDGGAGAGIDRIHARNSGSFDFRTVAIVNVEGLTMTGGAANTATFLGSQIGAGKITDIVSQDAGARSIIVRDNSVNLTALTFAGWGAANQTITIDGSNTILNNLTGSRQKDTINGNGSSIDIMRGGDGADTLNGGLGNDIFVYGAEGEAQTGEVIAGGGGSDIIRLIDSVSNRFFDATITGVEALDFQSGASVAFFSGTQIGAGPGSIVNVDGGTGADSLTVNAAPGANLSGVSFTAWTKGVDKIRINGDATNNTLTGSSQDDSIFGLGGNDDMTGLAGDDTYDVESAADKVNEAVGGGNDLVQTTVSYTLQAGAEIERIQALFTAGGDPITLKGNEFAQTITGHSGLNTLQGMGGADTLVGGGGGDTADYSEKTQAVVVFLNGAADAVVTVGGAAEDTVREIENITGGSAGDSLVGDSSFNVMFGGGGADFIFTNGFNPDGTIKSNANSDIIFGDAGDDGLFGGDGGDSLNGGDGNDGLVGGANADFLVGEAGGDFLFGGAFSPVDGSFLPGSGKDGLSGGAGNDGLWGFDDDDIIGGEDGDDYVEGGLGDDLIFGHAGSDFLLGQGGNDTINGGTGFDFMFGDAGADTFTFKKGDSADWILDFSAAQGDKIRFENFGFANFAAIPLVDLSTPGHPAVQLTFIENGNVDQLTIFGATLAQLNAGNVLLA